MFSQLVNHNDDIKRLLDTGYAISEDSGYLIVRDISYLDSKSQVQIGAIVTKMKDIDSKKVVQEDHQIFFAGGHPHDITGVPIPNLGGGPTQLQLSEKSADVVVQRSFSNKPKSGSFKDFFEKIENYAAIISGPAQYVFGITPLTFRSQPEEESGSVFKLRDTNTSRAEIGDLVSKFREDVVAIIGLGGTGAYLLDFLVKTPVREIRGFDKDTLAVHNLFRSPGKFDSKELGKTKGEVYRSRYENFRHGLKIEERFIDASSQSELSGVTFAFVCVDKGPSRAGIFDLLLSLGIPFIDVGMGLNRQGDSLNGMIRSTYYSKEDGQKVRDLKLAEEADAEKDLYHTNIQISELNALNACFAVIKFKQIRGFYTDETEAFHFLFGLSDLKLTPLVPNP